MLTRLCLLGLLSLLVTDTMGINLDLEFIPADHIGRTARDDLSIVLNTEPDPCLQKGGVVGEIADEASIQFGILCYNGIVYPADSKTIG